MRKHFLFLSLALLLFGQLSWAVDPSTNLATYYAGIDGKATDSNDALRKQLCTIISTGYNSIGYSSLQNSVYAASSDPSDFYNGSSKTMEDIYSSKAYTSGNNGSSASDCGEGWNKEHTVPQSWFNESTPMKSDAHHVFPTDIRMNSIRSSYPYGENNASKSCTSYGYGHLGTSTFSGYTGTVFDPGEKDANGKCYRGDIARVYFYMATRYRTTNFTNGSGGTSFTYSNGVADLTTYMKNLLLKWHREDPVSEKELIRNNAIYAHQNNRNPFVDYPCLVEYIWGDKQGEAVNLSSLISGYDGVGTDCCSASTDPAITSPTGTIDCGATNTSNAVYTQITIQGVNLTSGNLTLSISGTNASYFSLATNTVSSSAALAGTSVTITYSPSVNGTHSATLTISGCGVTNHTVQLTGKCTTVHTITWIDAVNTQTTQVENNGALVLPTKTPADCSTSRVFVGWTAQTSVSGTAPSDLFTTPNKTVTAPATYYAVYANASTTGGGGSSSTASYTFSDKSWSASPSNWTSGKDGNGYSNSGVQVTTGVSGANATCPTSYNNISSIVVSYCTNASKGAGTIEMTVGSTSVSNSVSTSGGTTARDLTFDFSSTKPSGAPQITVTCTTNSIYICGVTITYGGSGSTTYSNYSLSCSSTPITYVTVTFHKNDGTFTTTTQNVPKSTSTALTANPWSRDHYTFNGWNTKANGSGTSYSDGQSVTISAALDLYAQWTEDDQATVIFMNNGVEFYSQTDYVGENILISGAPSLTDCDDYTFEGWSTSQLAQDNTSSPTLVTPTTIPTGGATYYAVYYKTETTGGSGSGSTTNVSMEDLADVSGTVSGYNFATNVGEGSTSPVYNATNKDLRIYAKGTLTISSSTAMTGIVLNLSSQGKKRLAPITANVGSIATQASGDATVTWSGSATSVIFTVGEKADYGSDGSTRAGQLCFLSVDITTGSGGGGTTTTYHTTAPDCNCEVTITITSADETMGYVEFVE